MKSAAVVAQLHRAYRNLLDGAHETRIDFNVFANTECVIDQEKQARKNVPDQRLGPEADGDTDNARTGQQRRDINAERRQNRQDDEYHNSANRNPAKQRQKGLQPRSRIASTLLSLLFATMDGQIAALLFKTAVDGGFQYLPDHVAKGQDDDRVEQRSGQSCNNRVLRCQREIKTPSEKQGRDRKQDQQDANAAADAGDRLKALWIDLQLNTAVFGRCFPAKGTL